MIRILNARSPRETGDWLARIGVDKTGIKIMLPKAEHFLICAEVLNVPAANILKQELLSLGGDAALHKGACDFSIRETPALLIATQEQLTRLCKKLQAQPFGLKKFARNLKETLEKFQQTPPAVTFGSFRLDFSGKPLIMGILNVTPDSFSGDGVMKMEEILKKAEQLVSEGADILDIGGESTRPGAVPVPLEEERKRVVPAVKALSKSLKIPISADTSKAAIAEECLENGAHILNDVTALTGDARMVSVARKYRCPSVVMHHRFSKPRPADPVGEICAFFTERLSALESEGIPAQRLILDPGIGFGKDYAQNLLVLKNLEEFKIFGRPLLLGNSRKSFIGKITGAPVEDRLAGTLAALTHSHRKGVHIFRVHDVRQARQALEISQAIQNADGSAL